MRSMNLKMPCLAFAASAMCLVLAAPAAHAQWAVIDGPNLAQALLDEYNQLEQIGLSNKDALQQLENYKLEIKNLQKLDGPVRGDVRKRLEKQLLNNIKDYGRSLLNKSATVDANSDSYYVTTEEIVNTGIGNVPRSTARTDADLSALGLKPGQETAIGRDNYRDRHQYDRVLDDMRQVALTRQNAEQRAQQANQIAREMERLPDNNTVGAIQLLSAQNTLTYAQNEDLIKTQSALLKNQQETQVRLLVEKEEWRQRELRRLQKVKEAQRAPVVDFTP